MPVLFYLWVYLLKTIEITPVLRQYRNEGDDAMELYRELAALRCFTHGDMVRITGSESAAGWQIKNVLLLSAHSCMLLLKRCLENQIQVQEMM